jgi:methyl-CpG-binding domain protein 4
VPHPQDPTPAPSGRRPFSGPLLQELLAAPDPWRLLVGCVLLNRTRREQADLVWPRLFARWPDAPALADADPGELAELLRPLGLWRQRSRSLRELSAAWAAGERDVRRLPGCGEYAAASYAIFVDGQLPDREPADPELRAFLLLSWR